MFDDASALKQRAASIDTSRRDISPAECPYMLPNTVSECSRLNLQHNIMQQYLQTNTVAPIGHPHQIATPSASWTDVVLQRVVQHSATTTLFTPSNILDVGSGTGRWAIEMARQLPQSRVVGFDIAAPSRPYTDDKPTPTNYSFACGNLLRGLSAFADGTFDYVHMRFLSFGIPGQMWQPIINELTRVTALGGWVEIIDYALPINGGPITTQASALLGKALATRGIDLTRASGADAFLRQSPYPMMAISNRLLEMPLGEHGGAIGRRMAWNLIFAFSHLHSHFIKTGMCIEGEWEKLLQGIEREAKSPNYQPLFPLYITIGQRKG